MYQLLFTRFTKKKSTKLEKIRKLTLVENTQPLRDPSKKRRIDKKMNTTEIASQGILS